MIQSSESTSRLIVRQAITVSIAAGLASIPLALVAGVTTALLVGIEGARLAGAAVFLGAGLYVASVLVGAWQAARWVLVEAIACQVEKTRAEAARIAAEAEALAGNSGATIVNQNISAERGAKVKAQALAPTVRIMGKQVSWNQLNAVIRPDPEPRRLAVPREDYVWLLEQFLAAGHSRRLYAGRELPYSKAQAYPYIYKTVVADLVEAGAIIGRGDRAAGRLVIQDLAELVDVVDRKHPSGLVVELGPGNQG